MVDRYGIFVSPPGFSGVRVTRSLILCVCFVDRRLSLLSYLFKLLCCLSCDLMILINVFHSVWR